MEVVDGKSLQQIAVGLLSTNEAADLGIEIATAIQTLHNRELVHGDMKPANVMVDAQSRLSGLKTGADAYLSKPFEKEELLVRLQKLMELRKKLQAYYAAPNPVGQRMVPLVVEKYPRAQNRLPQ